MPKRTNDFQKLATELYKQLSAVGASVTESAMLKAESGAEREVDILIQDRISGMTISIAVECRGRTQKDDIQWIDCLIGKYVDLPVDKVIAVSKSGFSKAAHQKAQKNRIDTLTLEEALETDWPKEFVQLGIARVFRDNSPNRVWVFTEGNPSSSFDLSTPLFSELGEPLGDLNHVAEQIYEDSKELISKEINNQFRLLFKTLGDLDKTISIRISKNLSVPTFIDDSTTILRVTNIELEVLCSFSYAPVTTRHYRLGENQITQATISYEQTTNQIIVTAVQDEIKPNQARIRFEQANASDS